jgi:hypothetical protein
MRADSELELFLKSQAAEGQTETSDASFTLASEAALRKIAAFQLPFYAAWAVKMVQSIVASGSEAPIRIDLLATRIQFYFKSPGFTLDDLEAAFYDPQPSPNRCLRHLLSALWAVGLHHQWGFQVAFPSQTSTLIWDGHQLQRLESEQTRDVACVTIAPLRKKSGLSWVAGVAWSGSRNAEILLALSRYCYTCPVPLNVDGRRLDSLQLAPQHGQAKWTYPLTIGFVEEKLPVLPIPPGTFKELARKSDSLGEGGGWAALSRQRMGQLSQRPHASLAFSLCVHMKQVKQGKSYTWEPAQGPSMIYWVLDGVVIFDEPLIGGNTHCSVGAFLSADGLETDLSTFDLRDSPERERRVALARQAISRALLGIDDSFEEMVSKGTLFQRVAGGAGMVAGVGLAFVSPMHGLIAGLWGGLVFFRAGKAERTRVSQSRHAIEALASRLKGMRRPPSEF